MVYKTQRNSRSRLMEFHLDRLASSAARASGLKKGAVGE
jgi:hypothetical protein